ncbi:MAG: SAM-dependent chlorinase/fluorinase [Calditrichaceae bacterium]|nr:SAM-dependent chlorinase/fluorinase [Calditrichaceae bacterium]MBN2708769.1 SAM-dependent chlorinase/fluorinase [Calditrichaceae bacterium]
MPSPIITFLSDFGTKDGYPGCVKGVIKSLAPEAEVIDITHDITAFDIKSAAYTILNYVNCFPKGTIHLAVVDPTVGSERKAILIETEGVVFIGPDNGLFSYVYKPSKSRVYRIHRLLYAEKNIDPTFHARDIFGPAVALTANGQHDKVRGEILKNISLLEQPVKSENQNTFKLNCLTIDHFGNIISNLNKNELSLLGIKKINQIKVRDKVFHTINNFYSEKKKGEWLVLWNSLGFLEIAVSEGSAAELLKFDANRDNIYIDVNLS